MDNILFESSYQRDKNFFQEIYFYSHFRRPKRLIALIVMAILLTANIVFIFLFPDDITINIIGTIIGIVFFIVYFLAYRAIINLSVKREKEISSAVPVTYTISVSENTIIHRSSAGSEIQVDFSHIKRVFQTSHYILLHSNAGLLYAFHKDHFTIGNSEDFLKFLRTKGY